MPKQNSTYFSAKCFFCGKNNTRIHSRLGKTWDCRHCKETNPGPKMMKAVFAHMSSAAAASAAKPFNGAPAPKVTKTVTKIKAVAATKATSKPEAKKIPPPPKSAPAPGDPPASAIPPPAKRSGLGALIYG